ncbi:unnamed protein product [Hymenolepis diminuta]|uniref:DUF155 domain-containing protein n=1 Tax=Hymenolepis diminuta TaxID=6216 RepID=A0A0R3SGD1_HYMDI|nr:unnamed protein product [Hymenolepis diminuta]
MLDVEDIRLRAVPAKSDSKESQEVYEKEIQRLVMEKIAFSDALAASVIAADPSNYGVGAVISLVFSDGSKKAAAHASLILMEENYGQIEKEALAIVYAVKFHKFVYGRHLTLLTDHKFKLALLETSFDAVAVQMQPWIDKMQIGLGAFFPMSAVFRKTGELFTLRHLLNISTTISETPDFYWDRPEVEKLFQNLKNALSVQSRTHILNSKLNTCCELTEILTNHLEARHSSRLEWMIILLILVEVIFEISRWNMSSSEHQERSTPK